MTQQQAVHVWRTGLFVMIVFVAGVFGASAYACDNDRFVRQAYQDLLHRPVSNSELENWLSALNHGFSRTQFALNVVNGGGYQDPSKLNDVFLRNILDGYYQEFLHRPADPGAVAAFVPQLRPKLSEKQVIAQLVGSDEYCQRLGGTPGGGTQLPKTTLPSPPRNPPAAGTPRPR